MYLITSEETLCTFCIHKDICKYAENENYKYSVKLVAENISALKFLDNTNLDNLKIDITCKYYESAYKDCDI